MSVIKANKQSLINATSNIAESFRFEADRLEKLVANVSELKDVTESQFDIDQYCDMLISELLDCHIKSNAVKTLLRLKLLQSKG